MKKPIVSVPVLLLLFMLFQFPAAAQRALKGTPVVEPQKFLKDIMSLLVYKKDHLRFAEEFMGYDQNGRPIGRGPFLKLLATGSYVPIALTSQSGKRTYQLDLLPPGADRDLRTVIRQWGQTYYDQFSREGQVLPAMDFVDLEGRRYTPESTRGKIVVLKCWFISCLPCVQEMPELNRLVERYRNRKDILFVSLAIDPKDKLVAFLRKTKFRYAVVPGKGPYMSKQLRISAYPTHLVINGDGKIARMVNDADELVVALSEVANK